MTLKIVHSKGKGSCSTSEELDKGTFIIEAKNNKGEVGYIADVNKKISVSAKLIPQVVRYSSYKEAKRQVNHIKSNINGFELNILGKKRIEEILAGQNDLDVVVPINEVKDTYIVGVYDNTTKETIGYVTYNPDNKGYFMKKNKEAVAFWEGEDKVNEFIEGGKGLIKNYPNLELRAELNK
jgi:hypothetical protein